MTPTHAIWVSWGPHTHHSPASKQVSEQRPSSASGTRPGLLQPHRAPPASASPSHTRGLPAVSEGAKGFPITSPVTATSFPGRLLLGLRPQPHRHLLREAFPCSQFPPAHPCNSCSWHPASLRASVICGHIVLPFVSLTCFLTTDSAHCHPLRLEPGGTVLPEPLGIALSLPCGAADLPPSPTQHPFRSRPCGPMPAPSLPVRELHSYYNVNKRAQETTPRGGCGKWHSCVPTANASEDWSNGRVGEGFLGVELAPSKHCPCVAFSESKAPGRICQTAFRPPT